MSTSKFTASNITCSSACKLVCSEDEQDNNEDKQDKNEDEQDEDEDEQDEN